MVADSFCAECGSEVHAEDWTRIRHREHHSASADLLEQLVTIRARLGDLAADIDLLRSGIVALDERTSES